MTSILKPALFIYECVRVIVLSFTLVYQLPGGSSALPWMSFTVNGALFPLMALFIWLDISRYKQYLPLFIAGKCIGVLSLLGWLIIFRQITMINELSGVYIIAELFFLSGDLLAFGIVFFMFKDIGKLEGNLPLNKENDAEDN
jgi:hypothetical protein